MVKDIFSAGGGISKSGNPYCWLYSLEPVKNGYGYYPQKIFYEGSVSGIEFPARLDITFNERGNAVSLSVVDSVSQNSNNKK